MKIRTSPHPHPPQLISFRAFIHFAIINFFYFSTWKKTDNSQRNPTAKQELFRQVPPTVISGKIFKVTDIIINDQVANTLLFCSILDL